MKIVDADIRRASLPLRTPFVTALRRVEAAEFILLELRTDTGLKACGSAPATEAITGETLESIETVLRLTLIPPLLNRSPGLEHALETLHLSCIGNTGAKAAVDMALHSLAAQEKGLPLWQYLGGEKPRPVSTAVTISLGTPEQMLSDARNALERGEKILKVKVGADDGRDSDRIRAIADTLPGAQILVDANQAWDLKTALGLLNALDAPNIRLLEQPVPAADLEALRRITAESPVPVLADEAVFDAEDTRKVIETHAADMINIKLMKCGGIAEALKIIGLCRTHDIKCMLGSMLEGPVSITAALHLAVAHPDVFEWIDLDSPLLYRTLPGDLPFAVEGNRYVL